MHRKLISLTLLGMLLALQGCGAGSKTRAFMREDTSLAHIQRVAVLPFEGGGNAPRIREFTMTKVLASGRFDAVDKGLLDSILAQEAIAPGAPLDAATIRRLGQLLDVQGFIVGSVEQTSETRGNASFAEVIMTLRLLDSETGMLLWQASGRGSGYSLADRLLGISPKDSFVVTMKLLDDLFATLR